jgi:hypothetical protein
MRFRNESAAIATLRASIAQGLGNPSRTHTLFTLQPCDLSVLSFLLNQQLEATLSMCEYHNTTPQLEARARCINLSNGWSQRVLRIRARRCIESYGQCVLADIATLETSVAQGLGNPSRTQTLFALQQHFRVHRMRTKSPLAVITTRVVLAALRCFRPTTECQATRSTVSSTSPRGGKWQACQ